MDDACYGNGLCLDHTGSGDLGCLCQLGYGGEFCSTRLGTLDRVTTYNDGSGLVVVGSSDNEIESGTFAGDVNTVGETWPTGHSAADQEIDPNPKTTFVNVGAYEYTKEAYDSQQTVNVVMLAGAYLILSIIFMSYKAVEQLSAQYAAAGFLRRIMAADLAESIMVYLDPIPELAVAALGTSLVFLSMHAFQEESMMEAHVAHGPDPLFVDFINLPMVEVERLMIVITLTLLSRTSSIIRSKASRAALDRSDVLRGLSSELISITASVVTIILITNVMYDRTEQMRLLLSPIYAAYLTFEIVYLVNVTTTRLSQLGSRTAGQVAEFVGENAIVAGCAALAITLSVFVASRRAANLYDITVDGATERLEGTPFMQLGPRDHLCEYIKDDMLTASGNDDTSVSSQWGALRECYATDPRSGDATGYAHCCADDSGTNAWRLRAAVWGPLTLCLAALMMVSTETLVRLGAAGGELNPLKRLGLGQGMKLMLPKASMSGFLPARYSRIRVQTRV